MISHKEYMGNIMAHGVGSLLAKLPTAKLFGLESKKSRLRAQAAGAAELDAEKARSAEAAELAKTEKATASKQAAETLQIRQASARRQTLSGLLLTGEGEEPSRRRFLKGAK